MASEVKEFVDENVYLELITDENGKEKVGEGLLYLHLLSFRFVFGFCILF